jgi:hypothetical protein
MVMARQQSQVSSVQSTPSRSGTAMTWRSFGARSPSLVFGTELPLARHGSKNHPLTRKWCLRWPPMSLSVRLDPFAEPSATTAICAHRTAGVDVLPTLRSAALNASSWAGSGRL